MHVADLRKFERPPRDIVERFDELRGTISAPMAVSGSSCAMSWPRMHDLP
jgi:hypothetical protein